MKKKLKQYIIYVFFQKSHLQLANADVFTLLVNKIFQLILRINSNCMENVHFSSTITCFENIKYNRDKSTLMSFAVSGGCYFQAINGIELGSNFLYAPGVKIISANHNPKKHNEWLKTPPIKIGDNVWLGANVVILPGVEISNNCIIGAGSVITKSIKEENAIVVGNPGRILRKKDQ